MAQGLAIAPRLRAGFSYAFNTYTLSTCTTNRRLAYPAASPLHST